MSKAKEIFEQCMLSIAWVLGTIVGAVIGAVSVIWFLEKLGS